MIHAGSGWAESHRDQLLQATAAADPAAIANRNGDPIEAALWDFAGNATIGALPKAVSGCAVILALPQVIYHGWVGGIVSKALSGSSRFDGVRAGVYYVLTLVLQLTGYSMVVGAGVNAGVAILRPPPPYRGPRWLGIVPLEALRDFGWIYGASLPVFFAASLWEFLSPWNL